jgi:predicted small lipoprotein YifL
MRTRLVRIVVIVLLGAALAGCGKCGWFWEDAAAAPKSCRGDPPVN